MQKNGSEGLKVLAHWIAFTSLRWMRYHPGRFLLLSVVLVLFSAGCSSSPTPTTPGNGKKRTDLVDCNYFWQNRNRHVCIKDMPAKDCEDLFYMVEFQRDKVCVCDQAGREKTRVQGSGYVQYDCQ